MRSSGKRTRFASETSLAVFLSFSIRFAKLRTLSMETCRFCKLRSIRPLPTWGVSEAVGWSPKSLALSDVQHLHCFRRNQWNFEYSANRILSNFAGIDGHVSLAYLSRFSMNHESWSSMPVRLGDAPVPFPWPIPILSLLFITCLYLVFCAFFVWFLCAGRAYFSASKTGSFTLPRQMW